MKHAFLPAMALATLFSPALLLSQGSDCAALLNFKLATAVTPKGWSLEVAIPWHNFEEIGGKMPPKPGDVWTANLNRWDGTEPNRRLSVWSDTLQTEPNPHNPARFGRLTFR